VVVAAGERKWINGDPGPKLGDLVQWTSNNQDIFPQPQAVKGFSEDGEWAFVSGTLTGVPVSELTVIERPAMNTTKTPPANPFANEQPKREPEPTIAIGFKEDAYDLAEGRATFRWPEKLDKDSVAELEEWFELLGKKLRRLTGAEKKKP
jgi:hypothetical protein